MSSDNNNKHNMDNMKDKSSNPSHQTNNDKK
jgi:hypothetical protein